MSLLLTGAFVLGLALLCAFQPWWSIPFKKMAPIIKASPTNKLWRNFSYFIVICAYCFAFFFITHMLYF